MTVGLPEKPTAKQYEDLVTACFMALGYFAETRVVLRDDLSEVLELDLVATPSGKDFEKRMLVDAKSGKWGFPDLFKLFGWRQYLGIDGARIVHNIPADAQKMAALERVGKETGVDCVCLPVGSNDVVLPAPACNQLASETYLAVVGSAWYQQIAQRLAFTEFVKKCKCERGDLFAVARRYDEASKGSLFARTAVERVRVLYEAFQEAPKIAGEFVLQRAKAQGKPATKVWDELNDTHELLWLQHVMLLEHKARIAIIKNALDHAVGTRNKPGVKKIGKITIDWGKFLENALPVAVLEGMEELKRHPHGTRIPNLLQVFIELFGGFYVIGSRDIELMEQLSDIPAADIPACLNLYDKFFPFEKGWLYTAKNELVCLKMVPGFVRGGGCFLRKVVFDVKDYSNYAPQMGWLLGIWHNAAYHVLELELNIHK